MSEPIAANHSKLRAWMRAREWNRTPESTIRHRAWRIASDRRKWWDWGNPVMTLTGRAFCGSYSPPRGSDMWYRPVSGGFVTTYSYDDVAADPNEGWKIFDVQDDGFTIKMGYWPQPGSDGRIHFYGLDRKEQNLFLRWFLIDHKLKGEWFGLRRWIYYKALHAAVERKIPFTCQVTPDRGSGGYTHWHCQLKRKHVGAHRYVNYTWAGKGTQVEYEPAATA